MLPASANRESGYRWGRRAALWGAAGSGSLAILKITAGLLGHSTAVFSDGVESATDVISSLVLLGGMTVALKPPDADHPYGHGRAEAIAGKTISSILIVTGLLLALNSAAGFTATARPPELYAIATLLVSVVVKLALSTYKMTLGRRIGSISLQADAWNDRVDILSAVVALGGAGLAASDPQRFLIADRAGGFAVAVIVLYTGIRIFRDASLDLMDTRPPASLMRQVRTLAAGVPRVARIETCRGRKSGLGFFFDLHAEVSPDLTVRDAHAIAHAIKDRIMAEVPAAIDVLVHVEPAPDDPPDTAET